MSSTQDPQLEEVTCFYADGKLRIREFYLDGKHEGERKLWHRNGRLCMHEFYRDGIYEGKWKFWHDNGRLFVKQFFQDGKREGECRSWGADGHIWGWEFYRDSRQIDSWFTKNKKTVFLRIRRHFRKNISLLDTVLISDLVKMI